MHFLEAAHIHKQKDGFLLDDISFVQQEHQRIAVVGQSGSGKTTLLRILAGREQADTGTVLFEGKRVEGPNEKLLPGHDGIAYLSQHFKLRHNYRMEELLEYANTLSTVQFQQLLEICRIGHLLQRKSDQLSGGERQRIALARLLLSSPKLLLLDEPFSNLDTGFRQVMKSVIRDIGQELGITCMLVSHDPPDLLSWADQVLVLQTGKLIQQGTPKDVYRFPVNAYAASLFGPYQVLELQKAKALGWEMHDHAPSRIVRPEDFRIDTQPGTGLEGQVQAIEFFGSYEEAEVFVDSISIRVRIQPGTVTVGQRVYINSLRSS